MAGHGRSLHGVDTFRKENTWIYKTFMVFTPLERLFPMYLCKTLLKIQLYLDCFLPDFVVQTNHKFKKRQSMAGWPGVWLWRVRRVLVTHMKSAEYLSLRWNNSAPSIQHTTWSLTRLVLLRSLPWMEESMGLEELNEQKWLTVSLYSLWLLFTPCRF